MALEIRNLVKDTNDDEYVEAVERLCLTEDERLVPEDDPEARWLFCTPGARIRRSDLERYTKAAAKPADKAIHAPEGDKGSGDDDLAAARAEADAAGVKYHANAKAETIRQKIAEATATPDDEA